MSSRLDAWSFPMSLAHRIAAAAALLTLCAGAAQAAEVYQFNIDTSSIAGTTGYIELQFANGGAFGLQQEATATVSGFSSDGHFTETDPHGLVDFPGFPNVTGDVTGALPGVVTMTGVTTNFDDYLQGFTFGQSFSFSLMLSGPAVDDSKCVGGACSLPGFSLDLFALDGSGFLLTGDPTGANGPDFTLAQVQVNADGSSTPIVYPGPNGGAAALTVTAVPEPSAWALMLTGFGALGLALRRRRRALVTA
jgi:opacity protein-like surface antigen